MSADSAYAYHGIKSSPRAFFLPSCGRFEGTESDRLQRAETEVQSAQLRSMRLLWDVRR